MIREDRYIVIKRKEAHMALSRDEREELKWLCDKIADYRARLGKPPLVCVVVESDWPEYEPTWNAIQDRVEAESHKGGYMSEYDLRDVRKLEPYYGKHVLAMTSEGLEEKSDIAAELAFRDRRIADLESQLAEMQPVVEAAERTAKGADMTGLVGALQRYEARKPK